MGLAPYDVEILARTIFGEARGEPREGQVAVAWTVKNRFESKKWFSAKSVAGVCLKRAQYSCWNPGDPTYRRMVQATKLELEPFAEIGQAVFGGSEPDPTGGATHYYAEHIASPNWAEGKQPSAIIGHHLFFAGID